MIALGPADARDGLSGTIAIPSRPTVGELLEAMVVSSDNVACDRLLALVGGPRAVDAGIRGLGIAGITIRLSELEMGAGKSDNTSTPAAMVALLARIARQRVGLAPGSSKRLEDLLFRIDTGPKRIKGALPAGTPVAHKTGTSRTQEGKTDATNDVGLISLPNGHRVAVAIFVHASPADEQTREETIAISPAPPTTPSARARFAVPEAEFIKAGELESHCAKRSPATSCHPNHRTPS